MHFHFAVIPFSGGTKYPPDDLDILALPAHQHVRPTGPNHDEPATKLKFMPVAGAGRRPLEGQPITET